MDPEERAQSVSSVEERSQSQSPVVVMLLMNPFTHDSRVYKEARSLIRMGYRVRLLAMPKAGLPAREVRDGIDVERVRSRYRYLWRLAVAGALYSRPDSLRRWLGARRPEHSRGARLPATGRLPEFAARWRSRLGWPARRWRAYVNELEARYHDPQDRLWARPLFAGMAHWRHSLRPRVRSWGYRSFEPLFKVYRLRGLLRPKRILGLLMPRAMRTLPNNFAFARRAVGLAPDLVYCHDLNTLVAGTLVCRSLDVPLVYDSHELFLERNLSGWRATDRMVWGPIEKFCIRRCDAVISVADGICEHLHQRYEIPRPHLIRNLQPYSPPPPRNRKLATELQIDPNAKIVIYPGAVTINRGLEQLIEAAPLLHEAAFVIMGYGSSDEYVRRLHEQAERSGELGKRVFFRDAVPMDEVADYIAAADLCVVPTQNVCLSYFYESSNKIFHSIIAGVPLAMSDHWEKRLIAEKYGVGVLFDEKDPADIARTLNELLADDVRREQMSERCVEAARELNWEREEARLQQLVGELLGQPARLGGSA